MFFIFAKGAYDEGPDGPLRVPSDNGGLCKGEGGGDEGGAGGAEGMEGHLGEQAWSDKKAPRRGGGTDEGTEEST